MPKGTPMTIDDLNAAIEGNVQKAIKDGPRIRYDYTIVVAGRDRLLRRVLLGGLGSFGVGFMWQDEEPKHEDLPGFHDAPGMNSPPGWLGVCPSCGLPMKTYEHVPNALHGRPHTMSEHAALSACFKEIKK